MTVALGIDVGGTKLAASLVATDAGRVVASARCPTRADRGPLAALDDCVRMASDLVRGHDLSAQDVPVGIGVCELVAPDGRITSAATLDWRAVDVVGAFSGFARVVVESDVRVAAIAEARFGAAQGLRSCVYLTVGTGIAFTLLIDGVPYVGARGNALILGAPPVEQIASGAALARWAGVASAEEAFGLDPLPPAVVRGAEELGRAMAWLVNAFDPEAIVVGGGLGLRDEYRLAAVNVMRDLVEVPASAGLEVRPALLGMDAGTIGAALVAA